MNQMIATTTTLLKVSDAIEVLLQKGEGKVYVDNIRDVPTMIPAPLRPVKDYTHRFTAKYTRNALTVSLDCFVMVLNDGRVLVSTLSQPATTIRHSSTNVLKTTGTAYNVASNVKELYRVTTTYQVKPPEKEERLGIFKDNIAWPFTIDNYRNYMVELMSGLNYQISNEGREIIRLV